MKQTLTIKVLVVSAIALSVASGCERRTRPPAKPDAVDTSGGGGNIAGKTPAPVEPGATASPAPETASPKPETASPAPQTDDQKAAELNTKFDAYLAKAKELVDKKEGYISFVDGKDAGGKLTVSIDPKVTEAFYKDETAKLVGEDAKTIAKYKVAGTDAAPSADDVIKAMQNGLEGKDASSLKSVMEKFKADLSAIKPSVEANVTAQKANLDRIEAILHAIDDAVKQIGSLK